MKINRYCQQKANARRAQRQFDRANLRIHYDALTKDEKVQLDRRRDGVQALARLARLARLLSKKKSS